MGQDEVLTILEKLGGYATVPQMKDYARKHYSGSSMVTDHTWFYNKLTSLRKKWGLVGAVFDRSLGQRGLLIYYLVGKPPPRSPSMINYPYLLTSVDPKPKTCHGVTSVRGTEAFTNASSANNT